MTAAAMAGGFATAPGHIFTQHKDSCGGNIRRLRAGTRDRYTEVRIFHSRNVGR